MKINLVFAPEAPAGKLYVKYGKLISAAEIPAGAEQWEIEVDEINLKPGSFPTIVTVGRVPYGFSFHLRDVNSENPIWISAQKVAVLPQGDVRTYAETVAAIKAKNLLSDFARMEAEPEETYENAGKWNRNQSCPVWLGLGRDLRSFRVKAQGNATEGLQMWGSVTPAVPSEFRPGKNPSQSLLREILFEIGPGAHCRPKLVRRLDDGVLPILHATQYEESIEYRLTAFASLEQSPLTAERVCGSDPLDALSQMGYSRITDEENKILEETLAAETSKREEELICYLRVEAVNVSQTPTYAWFKAPHLFEKSEFRNGLSFDGDKVFAATLLNGEPAEYAEYAVLVLPGQTITWETRIFHSPVEEARGQAIYRQSSDAHLAAARKYWRSKLASAAKISTPEEHLNEKIQAGLLHLDLNTLGWSKQGPLLAGVGWYAPIGTESAPMIQYFDAMGWSDVAERCIDFFLWRQRDDGFIQVYFNYESETGPVLWTAAEHYRISRNLHWLQKVAPKLKKSCDFLLAWRDRNKKEEFRDSGGYGLLNGKVADPDDFFHSYFLNAGTYLGLQGMAEALQDVDPEYAQKLARELAEYRQDLNRALDLGLEHSPVIPTGDGSWVSVMPPWTDYTGNVSYYADGGNWYSHGAFATRSSLAGPLYFALTDLLAPHDSRLEAMLLGNQHPVTRENAALSQPYYSRHDIAHLKRGEVKLFLKTFYNQLSALQDRQSYTFWEHYYGCSSHKTHEEAWFLMQCRWMLALENGNTLELLKGIPRRWLEANKQISICGMHTHFGALDVEVKSTGEVISVKVSLERPPEKMVVRLPHPDHRQPVSVFGGIYDPIAESVTVSGGNAEIRLTFSPI